MRLLTCGEFYHGGEASLYLDRHASARRVRREDDAVDQFAQDWDGRFASGGFGEGGAQVCDLTAVFLGDGWVQGYHADGGDLGELGRQAITLDASGAQGGTDLGEFLAAFGYCLHQAIDLGGYGQQLAFESPLALSRLLCRTGGFLMVFAHVS
ncbi:MAG: hypothetical protein C0510_12580 [Erythrobacter sp.]|nr:hypothetical protein [Erythrobacter sp.]